MVRMVDTAQPIGWWLKRLDRLIEASFDDALGRTGVDRRQWQTLNAVADGAIREAALAERLSPFVDDAPAELGRVVHDLQTRGWLARDASGALLLTPRGVSTRDTGATVSTIRERLSEGITAEDYERTVDTLKRMAANLESALSV